jgi:hypothetical protein
MNVTRACAKWFCRDVEHENWTVAATSPPFHCYICYHVSERWRVGIVPYIALLWMAMLSVAVDSASLPPERVWWGLIPHIINLNDISGMETRGLPDKPGICAPVSLQTATPPARLLYKHCALNFEWQFCPFIHSSWGVLTRSRVASFNAVFFLQISRSYLNILGVRIVTRSEYHTEDSQMLGATVARATWSRGFVYPCSNVWAYNYCECGKWRSRGPELPNA